MDTPSNLDICQSLFTGSDMLVLATIGPDGPHTSLMAYVASPDGREAWMVTTSGSRKWDNIMVEPRVSLLVDDRNAQGRENGDIRALTVAGEYLPVTKAKEEESIRRALLSRHPGLAQFLDGPGPRLIRVRVRSYLLLTGPTESYYHDLVCER